MSENVTNGLLFNNQYYIPPEVLSLILSNVDVQTLYKRCTLVCKQWNATIKEQVCKVKCEQKLMKYPENKHKLQWFRQNQHPYYVYQTISVSNQSFYKNLIRNSCGMQGFKYWIMNKSFYKFKIEDYSLFDHIVCKIDDDLLTSNITKCFTIKNCEAAGKLQIIDLYEYGLTQQFIDEYQPPIYVSEWYGCRSDAIYCIYVLSVVLLDANYAEIDRCNCHYIFVRRFDRSTFGSFQKVCIIYNK